MTAHGYTVWLYKSSATDLSSGDVAYTFASQLASVPEPSGPLIRPLEGRAEAQSWTVSIVDSGSTVTGILADSTGRLHLLNRILAIRRTVDASTAAFLGVGRVASIGLNPNVAAYDLLVDDEHRMARITDIFTTNTTRLIPGGPDKAYGPFAVPQPVVVNGSGRLPLPSSGTQALVLMPESVADYDSLVGAVTADRVPWAEYKGMNASSSQGNYQHLRLRVWSSGVTDPNHSTAYTDCPVIGFPLDGRNTVHAGEDPSVGLLESTGGSPAKALPTIPPLRLLVYASTSVLPNFHPTVKRNRYVVLHRMGGPPTQETPLHIGGIAGRHPAALTEAIYTGDYSSAGAKLPRYSTAAMETWAADGRVPLMRFRLTGGRQPMARWLEDNLYAPNVIAPVTDSQGRIAPATMLQPQSSGVVGTALTGANLRIPHPGFLNAGQDQVTVAKYTYTHEMAPRRYLVRTRKLPTRLKEAEPSGFGGDLIAVETRDREVTLRSTIHGRHIAEFTANGWHTEGLPDNPSLVQTVIHTLYGNKAPANATLMGGHLLDRFADGAVTGTLHAMSTAEGAQAGDYVSLTLASYPNAETNSRGGTRILQLLSRQDTPLGPAYQYLDAGPSAQPLAAPSAVSLTAGPAGSTKHSLNVAVAGVSGRAYVQMAFGSTRPPAGSTRWESVIDVGTTATRAVHSLPANTTVHARAWNIRPRRFASTFAHSSPRATAALATISSFAPSSVGTKHVTFTWGNGEDLPVDLFAKASTVATFTSTDRAQTVMAGVNRHTYLDLTSNSNYSFAARHRDAYGGVSANVTHTTNTANTTGGLLSVPSVTLSILTGAST
jgi:hypothetical protein